MSTLMRTKSELVLGGDPVASAGRPDDVARSEPRYASERAVAARCYRHLQDIEPKWKEIEADGLLTAYQRLDWVRGICQDLLARSTVQPIFVEVFDATSLDTVMILPLMMKRRLGARIIVWLDLDVCDYAAPVLRGNTVVTAESARRCWAAVRAVLPPHDLLALSQIPTFVAGVRNPLALLPEARRMALTASGLDIQGDPKTFLARTCTKSGFKELNKFRRRIERRGHIRFFRASREADLASAFDCLLEQRKRRFQALGRFDLFDRDGIPAFYRNAALNGLSHGPAGLWCLSVNDEVIATSYCLVNDGIIYGLVLTSAGESWKNCSPGIVMVGELIKWAAGQSFTYMDMTIGSLPYKINFGAKHKELWQVSQTKTVFGWIVWRSIQTIAGSKTWLESHPKAFLTVRGMRRAVRRRAAGRQAVESD